MRNTLRNLFTIYSKLTICGEAIDGQQAIDAAVALKPDVVLLDFEMPNGNGLWAASEIKQRLPDLPIVMFTLFKTAALDLEARKVGVRVVVGKEEGVIKLLRAIEDELAQPIIVNEPQVPPGSESPQPNDLSA
jgi:DNA-binding NarL/FixJ family response regulator